MPWFGKWMDLFRPAYPNVPVPPKPVVLDHFLEALAFTTGEDVEGGYSDHPADRGGPTMAGVTQRVYDDWRRRHGYVLRPVINSTRDERTLIAREYWDSAHCPELPRRVAIAHFDAAFNHGPARAIRMLQQALRISVDGIWGKQTAGAVENITDDLFVVREYLLIRTAFYTAIIMSDPGQAVFITGWMNRVELLRDKLGVSDG